LKEEAFLELNAECGANILRIEFYFVDEDLSLRVVPGKPRLPFDSGGLEVSMFIRERHGNSSQWKPVRIQKRGRQLQNSRMFNT
jgi:hypothetical protein